MRRVRLLVLTAGFALACAEPALESAPSPVGSASETPVTPVAPSAAMEPLGSGLRFPYLAGERPGASVSIGDTSHGILVGGARLEENESLAILPEQRKRGLDYGTEELVRALQNAARVLHAQTGTRLWIGNLGRPEGGDIVYSVSHNAGRDADVAFCYADPSGKPVDPPDLVPLGKDGNSKDGRLRFDAARSWLVVRELLLFSGASVQYIFVSEPLKKKLLEQAKARGEASTLLTRANAVLRQPAGALPHDDHFHVRLYCSARDAGGGCQDTGPIHPFARSRDPERKLAAEQARKQSHTDEPALREASLSRLGLVGENADLPLAREKLDDPSPEVRVAAVRLLATLGGPNDAAVLAPRFLRESDVRVLPALIDAAGALGGEASGVFLRDLLLAAAATPAERPTLSAPTHDIGWTSDPNTPLRHLSPPWPAKEPLIDRGLLGLLAVRASAHADRLETALPMIDLLADAEPAEAAVLEDSLAMLTNHRAPAGNAEAGRGPAVAFYRKIALRHGPLPRGAWVASGFVAKGYLVKSLEPKYAWDLLRPILGEAHLSRNARAELARQLGEPRSVLAWKPSEACRHFQRALSSRRAELNVPRPTRDQLGACSGGSRD